MAFVKVYNGDHAIDLGFNQTWNARLGWKVGCKNTPSRKEIEGYVDRLGAKCIQNVGVKINPRGVEFLYHNGDHEAEFEARTACGKLIAAVNKSWSDEEGRIIPIRSQTVPLPIES